MSGDDSEYVESSKKISPRRRGKRPVKQEEEEIVKKEETESVH